MRLAHRLMVALLCAATLCPRGLNAQSSVPPDTSKRAAIRRLLAVQRTDSAMLEGIEGALANQPADPTLPASFRLEFLSMVRRDIGQFVERLVPVYDSLYSLTEVRQLLAFYQTPVGQRMVATQTGLAQAVSRLGEQWGMEVAAQVMLDLARRGQVRP